MNAPVALISPTAFAVAMEAHWTKTLGNVASEPLREAWRQLAWAFGVNIDAHGKPTDEPRWIVCEAPCGAGKTQGLILYSAMLAREEHHPGVLIVTRLIAEADEIAAQINRMAGREDYARAYHSGNREEVAGITLGEVPVLVITHRAYQIALGSVEVAAPEDSRSWAHLMQYRGGERRLVVIDESLHIVDHAEVTPQRLDQVRGQLAPLRSKFPAEFASLDMMSLILHGVRDKATATGAEARVVRRQGNVFDEKGKPLDAPDLSDLITAIGSAPLDQWALRTHDPMKRTQLQGEARSFLLSLTRLWQSWSYYMRAGSIDSLNTSRLLVPEGIKGAVVLDATAGSSLIYELFDRVTLQRAPAGVRNYQRLRLLVRRQAATGKGHVVSEAGQETADKIIAFLNREHAGDQVLILTHLDAEHRFSKSQPVTFERHVGHWQAVTGSNAWRDCRVAVIASLPRKPRSYAVNLYFATQGVQDTAWLQGGERPHGNHRDIRWAIEVGEVVSDVVQGLNRTRCRTVVDAAGNCPEALCYLTLPPGHFGDDVLRGVRRMLPGVSVGTWDLGDAVPREPTAREALLAYFAGCLPGRYAVSTLPKLIGISQASAKKLRDQVRDRTAGLAEELEALGVTYRVFREGKTPRADFVKA